MDINYFDLSGGINQASTKAELGLNPKRIFWSDSVNIELYNNKGITRQNGNSLLLELPTPEKIVGMCEMESDDYFKLVIVTESGKIYIYSQQENSLVLLEKTLTGQNPIFAQFLKGIIIATESDAMFYIKDNDSYEVVDCNLKDLSGNICYPDCVTIYKGRVWCSKDSTIYYSALGTYNDFEQEEDAGYINDFHTDTSDIITMNTYKDYLAIYKRDKVYLLSGSNPSDFAITLFADKGSCAAKAIVNVDNKQYFLSNGIYALEQVGELNQIRLGAEISQNIREEFKRFDESRMDETFVVHYKNKHQMWYFFPYLDSEYFHTIWINDYLNKAWYKRVVPQNVVSACVFNTYILTADTEGKVFREDYGGTFNGEVIQFMWKSPFLALGNVLHRKLIDEFYFILDDINDNKFKFSLYKDYDSEYKDDVELIFSKHFSHFMWAGENTPDNDATYCWHDGESEIPVWPINSNPKEKAEICDSNYSIQLCIEGDDLTCNCAIIGLQFREIYNDD